MKIVTRDYFTKSYLKKCQESFIDPSIEQKVGEILREVRRYKDRAVLKYTYQFDHVRLAPAKLAVQSKEFEDARKVVSKEFVETFKAIEKNIRRYQKELLPKDWIKNYPGKTKLGALYRPIDRVGVYIPGGTAPLVSTVLMTVIPAKVAGVKEVIVTTPPNKEGKINPYILAACELSEVSQVFRVGGAQAIAAMAFGTETISKVDKIVGPGNIYVASAKRQVYGFVGIDMVAGPSEVLILADESANPKYVAADLLAQAEHDVRARTFLVTTSQTLAESVSREVEIQIQSLTRSSTAHESIRYHGFIVVVDDLDEAVDLANEIAPEHLEILCKNSGDILPKIRNAGAVFLGESTPEPVGDYVAGPSHVLPTGGTARFFSPLSSRDFIKSMSYLEYNRTGLKKELEWIQLMASVEGLDAHRKSSEIRFS